MRSRAAHAGIELVYNGQTSPRPLGEGPGLRAGNFPISGDADALRQLFVNLLLNAIEAVSGLDGERKRIEVEVTGGDDHRAIVKISDSGPGPAAEVAERLFEPFITDKPEGTGLGLYVARQTVEAHQGRLRWQRQNGMTCFEVEFPCCEA